MAIQFIVEVQIIRVSEKDLKQRISSDFAKQHLMDSMAGKTIFLGKCENGKSSLTISLIEGTHMLNHIDDRTQVMGLHVWNLSKDEIITVIDVGGHHAYQQLAHLFHMDCEFNLCVITHDINSDDLSGTTQWVIDVITKSPLVKILIALTKIDLCSGNLDEKIEAVVKFIAGKLQRMLDFIKRTDQNQTIVMLEKLIEMILSKEIVICVSCESGEGLEKFRKTVIDHFRNTKIPMPEFVHTLYLEYGKLGANEPNPDIDVEAIKQPKDRMNQPGAKVGTPYKIKTFFQSLLHMKKSKPSQQTSKIKQKDKETVEYEQAVDSSLQDSMFAAHKIPLKFVSYEKMYDFFKSKVPARLQQKEEFEKSVQLLSDIGVFLWFNHEGLSDYIFNDIGSFIEMLKLLFVHDMDMLSYSNLLGVLQSDVLESEHKLNFTQKIAV
jgi:hypothetical protein